MPPTQDRRISGEKFREMSQGGYDRLINLLRADGVNDLVDQLSEFDCVEDLMREVPTLVPVLLELAWNARHTEHLSDFFLSSETGVLADHRDAPLAPCGRSFSKVVHGHLIGAARLYFSGLEKRWSGEEAKRRTEQYQNLRAKKRRNPFGFLADTLKSMFRGHPTFRTADMRAEYSGRNQYSALKPFLLDPQQFQLIPYYAHLNARQVKAIGSLLRGMHVPQSILAIARYDSRHLGELCRCALAFARTVLSFSQTAELYAQPQRPKSALNEGVDRDEVLAGEILSDLVINHEPHIDKLLANLDYAEPVIKVCAVSEGHNVWALFGDTMALDNIVLCPEEIVLGIGALAGSVSPYVSSALEKFENPTIPRDFILFAKDKFGEDVVREWLSDDVFLSIWQELPAKFNKVFPYSRDSEVSTQKNLSDLKAASTPLFQLFRDASPEGQPHELKQAA